MRVECATRNTKCLGLIWSVSMTFYPEWEHPWHKIVCPVGLQSPLEFSVERQLLIFGFCSHVGHYRELRELARRA